MKVPEVELRDGHKIPQVGLGLWQVRDEEQFDVAVEAAVKAGYRHFDSAQIYKNEHMLGRAWKKSGLNRKDIFITTKIAVNNFKYGTVHESFKESLEKLQTDYVDLLLLHFPVTFLRKKAWQALEEIQKNGGANSIGVSNYTIRHLKEMESYSGVVPAVNQVELHIFLQQPELVEYCKENNIVVEAYSPLAHAHEMNDETINSIAKKHDKTYAQVMLRWLLQKDLVILPKSVTPSRIAENIDIFDFELDEDDLAKIANLDKDMRTCWSPVHVP
ncbi:MAG: aldo/keto reductase [Candidatus Saccharimonadales bacterium]